MLGYTGTACLKESTNDASDPWFFAMTRNNGAQGAVAAGLVLLAVCGAAYWAYSLGFNADWTFDDSQSLSGLSEVRDIRSARDFALSTGPVGGMGRPLAMGSFLINARDWPDHPAAFRQLNVLLHLINGVLIAWVGFQAARFVPRLAPRAALFAVTLSAVWTLHPFLASASLMVVQRMTVLAGAFTLLGMAAYLHGRARLKDRPISAYLWMSAGLTLGSLLGFLAKEIAALLPLLAGVLEWTILTVYAPVRQRYWRAWRLIFFGGTAFALLAYVAWGWRGMLSGYQLRSFGVEQRILSEAVILFDYLRQILWPDVTRMGPFQDDTVRILGSGSVLAWTACAAWLLLIAASVLLRRRSPPFSFAVLFYATGHLLESTVFPLELYFEHRNYLPSLGPIGAVVGLAWTADSPWPRRIVSVAPAVLGWLLWKTASLWGQADVAAPLWASAHPTSARATQNLAAYYYGQRNYTALAALLEGANRQQPQNPDLAIQALMAKCFVCGHAEFDQFLIGVAGQASKFHVDKNALINLGELVRLRENGQCSVAGIAELQQLVRAFMENPIYRRDPTFTRPLLLVLARLHMLAGDTGKAIAEMRNAFKVQPSADLAQDILGWLIASGYLEAATEFVDDVARRLSAADFDKRKWLSRIENQRELQADPDRGSEGVPPQRAP